MAYTPNAEDAFTVYMIAIASVDDIPQNAFAPAHLMNVKELWIKGEFYIWPDKELDIHGRFVAPLATCTYMESSQIWSVELITGHLVQLRDAGDVWDIVKTTK